MSALRSVARDPGGVGSDPRGTAVHAPADILACTLANIDSVAGMDESDWEALLGRAREANLVGTLAERIAGRSLIDGVPRAPRAHLVAGSLRARAQAIAIRRELAHVARALADVDTPAVLLKGAAYLCTGLPHAHGRVFSDVDLLVPKRFLPAVESALMRAGFVTTHTSAYDQRYYRRWMHELPPMVHVQRKTILDVHHALVPETSRMHPDSTLLFESAQPVDDSAWLLHGAQIDYGGTAREEGRSAQPVARFFVLAPADMAIHCATHLFCDEEWSHAPRDLVDFDGLVREFGTRAGFWDALVPRARKLDLARPLAYALNWSARIHHTPVPAEVLREARADLPPAPVRQVMNALLGPALRATRGRASTRWARRALYLRGHWLKMPPHLLAWHLSVKALRRDDAHAKEDAQTPEDARERPDG